MRGAGLAAALQGLGMSRQVAAAGLGVTDRTLRYYLAGRRIPPAVQAKVRAWVLERAAEDKAVRRALRQLSQKESALP